MSIDDYGLYDSFLNVSIVKNSIKMSLAVMG